MEKTINCKTKIKFLNRAKEFNAVGIIRPPPKKKYQSKRKIENEEKNSNKI